MKKFTLTDRLRYKFDNLIASGSIVMIGILGLVSLLLIIVAGTVLFITGFSQEESESLGFIEASWQSLMRTLDPGTMGQDTGWGYRLTMLFVTLGGIFIVSTFIGILANGISNKLDELRKGHSFVIEKNHILILGWSEKIFSVISELVIANENQKKPRIVILARKDKAWMEDTIRSKLPNLKNTRVVCRNGNPLDLNDLSIVNLNDTKSIIILSDEEPEPDVHVIKTILAITNNPERKKGKYHIVAELTDPNNKEIAETVSQDEVTIVHTDDLISRLIAQTCRQSGLSLVYTELLDFGGDEIYFHSEPALEGKTFREALSSFEDSSVIGLCFADGSVKINPGMSVVIQKGDRIIAISEDDDKILMKKHPGNNFNEESILKSASPSNPSEHILLIGWNHRAPLIIKELDNYLSSGSKLTILTNRTDVGEILSPIKKELKKLSVIFIEGNPTCRKTLEEMDFRLNHIILLSTSDVADAQDADSHTLITLLLLRNIAEKRNINISIVSEMLDIRNKELAEITKADDFIISNKLISLMLSQLSENKLLKYVFDDLFDSEGSEIYIKPVSEYIRTETETDFYTVLESAARKNEVAIGYRICSHSHNAEKNYGVIVNPEKSAKINFSNNDKLIVLAEE